ncbi:GNAT family N-acetyltransferase [Meridianimarinicoccus aquatilis]|uniref:GNAT family N-acetyltransferase n=1 Tax=Meridianimarinicoccus aquatilis TaxID=2552766 RepID=A0A4R6B537_9RHOB|nr:GNAT family N-acetyltransferase [Fluviibacterium aquatile]QIE42105.1 GNAT family N-acetyltransferase [Rhodobacteraceae bacterium SC52]TDL90978.1 GNAT family N-acetyltransferase [Fluviibacterium aquatile]
MSVMIRPLQRADREVWGDLWRGYLAFYETTRPDAQFDLHFERLTDPNVTEWHGLLAVYEGTPVGLAHVLLHPHGWQPEPTAYLQDLYVAPATRGVGAGRALMHAVYALADRLGAQGTYWTTQDFNTTARKLYDNVGMLTPFVKYART